MTETARTDIRRYLNIRSAMAPRFSPDGKSVAYLMNTTGVPQVWRIPLDGGAARGISVLNIMARSAGLGSVGLSGTIQS